MANTACQPPSVVRCVNRLVTAAARIREAQDLLILAMADVELERLEDDSPASSDLEQLCRRAHALVVSAGELVMRVEEAHPITPIGGYPDPTSGPSAGDAS
jgi:hypothetical protein